MTTTDRRNIGLSTYAFFWQWHESAAEPITLEQMLDVTRDLGGDVFQVCDYPPLQDYSHEQVTELAAAAAQRGLRLEFGTRGIEPEHLARYLELATQAGVTLVRSMVPKADAERAVPLLRESIPAYAAAGVTLALETYEQVPTDRLAEIVREVDSPYLGICLDPANSVAALEHPLSTIETTAPLVKNIHVKDFAFSRAPGWVGFTYGGAALGEGLLDYGALVDAVRPAQRGISRIVEHWVVWPGDSAAAITTEQEWTAHAMRYLLDHP